ncbi:hypothetical protein LWI28_009871 [Acer negundo]|uniref:Uncharacterized protein n=1 Tax=Acer negundo TaxID=4023 RepID=A0AAD5IDC3_ACENE|nr:hypothetical protein LWI28_009871 [Acer negundo]
MKSEGSANNFSKEGSRIHRSFKEVVKGNHTGLNKMEESKKTQGFPWLGRGSLRRKGECSTKQILDGLCHWVRSKGNKYLERVKEVSSDELGETMEDKSLKEGSSSKKIHGELKGGPDIHLQVVLEGLGKETNNSKFDTTVGGLVCSLVDRDGSESVGRLLTPATSDFCVENTYKNDEDTTFEEVGSAQQKNSRKKRSTSLSKVHAMLTRSSKKTNMFQNINNKGSHRFEGKKVVWNLKGEIAQAIERGVTAGMVLKSKKLAVVGNGDSDQNFENERRWNIEEEVTRVIKTRAALGVDFNNKENEMIEILASREVEDEARMKDSIAP